MMAVTAGRYLTKIRPQQEASMGYGTENQCTRLSIMARQKESELIKSVHSLIPPGTKWLSCAILMHTGVPG